MQKIIRRFPSMEGDATMAAALIQSASKALTVALNQPLAAHGMSEGRFFVLLYLLSEEVQEHPAPSPSDIADNVGVTRATVTGLLDGLERDGLIRRCHDSPDRRAITVAMTEKASAFLDVYAPVQAERMREFLSPLTTEEQRTLIRLLTKLDVG